MKVLNVLNPFEGEHVIGLSPVPAAEITDWNRRLNLFSGRALTFQALTVEQNGVAGRFALHGQMVSPGVVAGLEVALNQDKISLSIATGLGVTASGEDVFVPLGQSVNVKDISVYAPAVLLDGGAAPAPGDLVARRLGDSLAALIAKNLNLSKVGILLLQPIIADVTPNFDVSDPCEQDPQNDAFSDAQFVDGCRLVYYAWPEEWLALPPVSAVWRNSLAYSIFAREAQTGAEDLFPWEQIGLPVGLLAFDSNWNALFIDRYAVVRDGGKAKRRTSILANSGDQFLWQARIQQFIQQIVDSNPSATAPASLGSAFSLFPPAGVVPKNALVFGSGLQSRILSAPFFPASWNVSVVPIPTEQLDYAIQASAPLAALDASRPEDINVLVPVPQIWFEPDLLQILQVDPAFQAAVDQFSHSRAIWLKRRLDVRASFSTLFTAVNGTLPKGTPPLFPDLDPDAVETEQTATTQIDPNIGAFVTAESSYGVTGTSVDRIEALKATLKKIPGVQAETEIDLLGVPGTVEKPELGLDQFISHLQAKVNSANDTIDFGFLHAQTDIYRTRQNVLGTEATRLVTSPVLAMIAQGQTALATNEDLTNLVAKLRPPKTAIAGPLPEPAGGTGTSGGTVSVSNPRNLFIAGTTSRVVDSRTKTTFPTTSIDLTRVEATVPAKTTTGQITRVSTTVGAPGLFAASQVTIGDVQQQRPIVGADYELRSTTLGERLKDPPSTQSKQYAVASKYTVMSNFVSLATNPVTPGINISDISVPGFLKLDAAGKVLLDTGGHPTEDRKLFSQIDATVLGQVLSGLYDPAGAQDEAGFFTAGVRAMENTVEILRLVEGRVQAYQSALDQCNSALNDINVLMNQADRRLKTIADELGTARHDVAFSKGLLAEETMRVRGINRRRDRIVFGQAKFLAYVRPRSTEAILDMQVRSLDPAMTESPIPACLARNLTAPAELRAMINLLREAPLKWFVQIPPLLHYLNRIDILQTTIVNAKLRAGFKLFQAPEPDLQTGPGPLAPNILNLYSARRQTITNSRLATSNLDLTEFAGQTWETIRQRATEVVSIGDLIDHGHFHPNVPRVSAQEIENILKVSACLYSDFAAVLPAIRLNWAERLIQIGGPLNLSNLASLPSWAQVPILERKEMQAIVDWLFSRVVATETDAVAHINDLIRLCLLLASHAPVADIIAGSVIRPTPIIVNTRVDLAADLSRVSIGMHVLMYSANQVVARAVVENLSSGQATARILTTTSDHLTLAANSKVHFAAPDSFERNPFTAGKLM